MKNLVIVESPAKGRTISKFLGQDYKVMASFGHVRDLPRRELGVDVENNFEPKYVVPPKARKVITELKKESAKADNTILATDEDREGESIAWHLAQALGLGASSKRIVFHEITENAIKNALQNPRNIDINMVNAQQARRILDRIVGYKISPFLWKKVARGLSAGRVQSVAVRLIAEREKEIEKFVPVEYWSIEALLKKGKEFTAKLIDKEINNKQEADKILQDLNSADYVVESVEKKETKRYPAPPFTTSTLQQASWQRFKFSAKMTMSLAQRLYEEGHITYHRTDSLNLSESSLIGAKNLVSEKYGKNYWSGKLVKYATKSKGAQEAHEAIRPTFADRTPQSLENIDPRQSKLYTLIWQRFIASQMSPAIFDSVSTDIKAEDYIFRANGQTLRFDGFLKVYPTKFEETELPDLKKDDSLELVKLSPLQHFTEPPARYTEASLVKTLEKYGIGRPSTYAPIISVIQERNYVAKNDQKRFFPSEMGVIVNDVLVKNFPEIVDIDFTAKMEKELDEIAEGKDTWQKTCKDFYSPFAKNLEKKYKEVTKSNLVQKTDKTCPKCKAPLVERLGRFGKFYACSKFPECKYTESVEGDPDTLNIPCPKCLASPDPAQRDNPGQITGKRTKKGKIFYGCNRFPKCDFALWDKPVNEFCPECGAILVEKLKKVKCSNKDCDYAK